MKKQQWKYTAATLAVTIAIILAGVTGMTLFARFSTGAVGELTVIARDGRKLTPFTFSSQTKGVFFTPLESYDASACVSFWAYTDTKRTENPAVFQKRKSAFWGGIAGGRTRFYAPYAGLAKAARLIQTLADYSSGYQPASINGQGLAELEMRLADSIQIDRSTKLLYLQNFEHELNGERYLIDLICSIEERYLSMEEKQTDEPLFYFKSTPKSASQNEPPSKAWAQQNFSQLCDGFYQDLKAGKKFELDFSAPTDYGINAKLRVESNPLTAFFMVLHGELSPMLINATGGQLHQGGSKITHEPVCAVVAGEALLYYVQQWEQSGSTLVFQFNPAANRVEGVSIF